MRDSHKKIIDAIIKKADTVCPDSLAMIAVYGSVASGDEYDKSDLDLLILINDDNGWQLGTGFILDDEQVGYDIYCTIWDGLKKDAECRHAHLNKLLDSKVIYVSNETVREKFEKIRQSAIHILQSDKRYDTVDNIISELYLSYAKAMLTVEMGEARAFAADIISRGLDAVMVWNGRYFRRGIKRTCDELEAVSLPDGFMRMVMKMISAKTMSGIKTELTLFVRTLSDFTKRKTDREYPTKNSITGTYEEMYSNWRNKMYEAAERKDGFSSFMNLASLHFMIQDISHDVPFETSNVMQEFDAENLETNASVFDEALEKYLEVYHVAGIEPRHYANVDAFLESYLQSK